MANMSYCRNENTAEDLADVLEHWDDFDPEEVSIYELKELVKLRKGQEE